MNTHRIQVSSRLSAVLMAVSVPLAATSFAQTQPPPAVLLSTTPSGTSGNSSSYNARISADGQRVAYWTMATDLAAGNCAPNQIVVRDMNTGASQCVVLPPPLVAHSGFAMTPDGAFLVLTAGVLGDNANFSVYIYEVATRALTLASKSLSGGPAVGRSYNQNISSDGRFVSFQSDAADLVNGDTNQKEDVFLFDRVLDHMERISVPDQGGEGDDDSGAGLQPKISDDGRFVAFYSEATNLVSGDTNAVQDTFLRDRLSGRTFRTSLGPNGVQLSIRTNNMRLARNGRSILFSSYAPELVPVATAFGEQTFHRNIATGEITLLSKNGFGAAANGRSVFTAVSPDETHLVMASSATDLAGAQHPQGGYFLIDLANGGVERLVVDYWDNPTPSVALTGVSDLGRHLVYHSLNGSVAANDFNDGVDVFFKDLSQHYVPFAESFCSGDGTAGTCPCGGGTVYEGAGCDDSWAPTGHVLLSGQGIASVADDTLRLSVTSSHGNGILVQGTAKLNNGLGVPFDFGLLCVGGTIARIASIPQGSTTPIGFPAGPPLSVVGGVAPGGTVHYQFVFRALSSVPILCPAATRNTSNAIAVTWLP